MLNPVRVSFARIELVGEDSFGTFLKIQGKYFKDSAVSIKK
jgi:hypothetical protein